MVKNLKTEKAITANWQGEPTQIIVSVCCTTYNHELYIEDAIEGFLIQDTNFPFEILIHDDASTDLTADIIREYESKYPNLIKPIYQTENQYSQGNRPGVINWDRAKGKYIALCEGDDYWTDPLKLQKQADILDSEADIVLTFLNTRIMYENGSKERHLAINEQKGILTLKDLIRCAHFDNTNPLVGPAHTSTAFFRNGLIKKLPKWFHESASGDLPLYMLLGKYGNAKFVNEVASVYRKNDGGITATDSHGGVPLWLNRIKMYKSVNSEFNFKYRKIIRPIISQFYLKIAYFYRDSNRQLFLNAITKAIINDPSILHEALSLIFRYKYRIRMGIHNLFFYIEKFTIFFQNKK